MGIAWPGYLGRTVHRNQMSRLFWNIDDLAMNGSSFAHYWQKGSLRFMINRIFFPSNAFMAFARSLHTFNRSKKDELKISMQGRQFVDSLKRAGNGPIHSPVSNPIKIKPNQKRSKQTNKKHTTTTKPNQTEHRGVGSLPAMGITCMMTSCVSL